MNKILVTPRSLTKNGHPALRSFKDAGFEVIFCSPGIQPSENELMDLLPDCIGYLAGVEKVSASVLKAASKLKAISRNGVGLDNIDLVAAEKLGIKVYPTIGANSRGVAELTVGLIFALVRSIPFCDAFLKSGKWERRKGIELEGRTIGLIGCGMIGKFVTQMALGLGMKVRAYDMYPDSSFNPSDNFRYVSFDEILKESDIISLHCPASEDGTPIINKDNIDIIKNGAYVINASRASLIDKQTILAVLDKNAISGLATDVFDEEPPSSNDKLVAHNKVIVTPHIGAFTEESILKATEGAVESLLVHFNKK